jgi:hypothetical protein
MRRSLALLIALLLATLVAVPAEAATVHRTFVASVGTSGSSGSARIAAYTDGNGLVTYALKRLRANWTYRVEIRNGRCSSLGSIVNRLPAVKASASGTVNLAKNISTQYMFPIWKANWSHRLAIRFVNGTSVRCGNLNFTSATRVYIQRQGILNATVNLPIVRGPNAYPYCNVAMFQPALNQPTEPAVGATFIYAHARKGMFLPLLAAWNAYKAGKGPSLIGMKVWVWTSNSKRHTYQVYSVRQSNDVQSAVGEIADRLWLQTSTGPNYTYPKLVIKAKRIATDVSSYDAAHPTPHIVHCG